MYDCNAHLLTLDIDWAPDFAIEFTAELLRKHNVKATWFVTHDSEAIRHISEYPDMFELGIHPNFLRNSTHGDNERSVIQHVLDIVPAAKVMRTHSLYQSTPLLRAATSFGIEVDLSLLLPHSSHLQPHELFFDDRRLVRLPTFWEDDIEMSDPDGCLDFHKSCIVGSQGLKIYSFHPIHIYLNSSTSESYDKLKQGSLATKSLHQVEPYVRNGTGTRSFFEEVCEHITQEQGKSYTISELANEWELAE